MFGIDTQWQKELKAIIRTLLFYWVFCKTFNADSTCIFTISENVHLEDSNGISLTQARIWRFLHLFFFFKYFFSTQILWRIAWPISSYL